MDIFYMGLQREYLNIYVAFWDTWLRFLLVTKRHQQRMLMKARKNQTHLLFTQDTSHQRKPSFLSCKCCGDCFTQDWKAARLHSMTATQQSTAKLYTTKEQERIAGFKSDTHLQQMFRKHFVSVF